MTMRPLRRLLFTLGILAVLAVLFTLEENWRGHRAWTAWKASQEAAGHRYDLAAYLPGKVRDADNFAMAPVFALTVEGRVALQALWETVPLPVEGNWAQGRPADFSALDAQGKDPTKALAPFDEILGRFADASLRPACSFPPNLDNPFYPQQYSALLQAIGPIHQALRWRALARVHGNFPQGALEDIETTLRASRLLQRQPDLQVGLVAHSEAGSILQPVWEGLRAHAWNPAQLARLQEALASMDLLDSFRQGIHGERYVHAQLAREVDRQAWCSRSWLVPERAGLARRGLQQVPLPKGWFHQGMVDQDQAMARLQAAADGTGKGILALRDRDLRCSRAPYCWAAGSGRPGLAAQARRCVTTQVGLDQAHVACALERYRLARGGYPARLEDLVPSCLAQVPLDRLTGNPMGYDLQDGVYHLRATGWPDIDKADAPPTPGVLTWASGPAVAVACEKVLPVLLADPVHGPGGRVGAFARVQVPSHHGVAPPQPSAGCHLAWTRESVALHPGAHQEVSSAVIATQGGEDVPASGKGGHLGADFSNRRRGHLGFVNGARVTVPTVGEDIDLVGAEGQRGDHPACRTFLGGQRWERRRSNRILNAGVIPREGRFYPRNAIDALRAGYVH
jgi:hypothetical protein